MYHSIIFGKSDDTKVNTSEQTVNTWDNWRLIPTTRPVVSQPVPEIRKIRIPGSDRIIDLSRYLNGKIQYGNRTGTFEFLNDRDNDPQNWTDRLKQISTALNGSEDLIVWIEDDPDMRFRGRMVLSSWANEECRPRLTK